MYGKLSATFLQGCSLQGHSLMSKKARRCLAFFNISGCACRLHLHPGCGDGAMCSSCMLCTAQHSSRYWTRWHIYAVLLLGLFCRATYCCVVFAAKLFCAVAFSAVVCCATLCCAMLQGPCPARVFCVLGAAPLYCCGAHLGRRGCVWGGHTGAWREHDAVAASVASHSNKLHQRSRQAACCTMQPIGDEPLGSLSLCCGVTAPICLQHRDQQLLHPLDVP
jgi:hypothetical protein